MHDETVTRFYQKPEGGGHPGDAGPPAQLVVVEGPSRGSFVDLGRPETRIGRKPDNDLVLASPAVSKYHARVICDAGRFEIEDLGSTNGISANGVRLDAGTRRTLFHGDSLAIGDHLLIFRQAGSGSFADKAGMSTISFDVARVRQEAEELLRELQGPSPGE